jgi:hypothetical protein
MKFRTSFVSNSSAASFIIKFNSSLNEKEVAEAIKKCHKWIADNWDNDTPSTFSFPAKNGKMKTYESPPPLLRKDLEKKEDHYEYVVSTSMFNDWMEISSWPFVRMLSEDKHPNIKLIEIIQTESQNDSTVQRVDFDPRTFAKIWHEENHSGISKRERTKQEKEAKEKQEKIEIEYLAYLSNLGVIKLTDDQIVLVAKHHLKNEKD